MFKGIKNETNLEFDKFVEKEMKDFVRDIKIVDDSFLDFMIAEIMREKVERNA